LFKDKADIHFLLVGSEGIISKEVVSNLGFRENEYLEYKQVDKCVYKIIERKYLFAWKTSIDLYPDLDILLTNGSSDFIPITYFENIIHFYNEDESQLFGINGFNDGGSVFLLNNTFNDIYQLSTINNARIQEMNFIGGIYGFSKKLLENVNYNLILPRGNEYVLEKYCLETGKAKLYYSCDYFINFKIDKADVTNFKSIKDIYKPIKILKYSDKNEMFYLFYNLLKELNKVMN
jgi:hypothetical protein